MAGAKGEEAVEIGAIRLDRGAGLALFMRQPVQPRRGQRGDLRVRRRARARPTSNVKLHARLRSQPSAMQGFCAPKAGFGGVTATIPGLLPLETTAATVPVLLPLPLDEPFDYALPTGRACRPATFVEVPFGPRHLIGVVWDEAASGRVAGAAAQGGQAAHRCAIDAAARCVSWCATSPRRRCIRSAARCALR